MFYPEICPQRSSTLRIENSTDCYRSCSMSGSGAAESLQCRMRVQANGVEVATTSLTRGQFNAVRSAFKAGVTPSRIARQFGLSQSDVRKALASEAPKH